MSKEETIEQQVEQPVADTKEIEVDGRKFNSVEELAKSYSELSKVIGRQGQELGSLRKLQKDTPQTKADFGVESDKLFEDPAGTIQKIVETAERNVISKLKAEQEENSLWDEFFTKNENLKPLKSKIIADTYSDTTWNKIKSLGKDDQFKTIAAEWSQLIPSKQPEGYVDELPKGKTPASAGSSAKTTTDSSKEKSLSDMVSSLKKRK